MKETTNTTQHFSKSYLIVNEVFNAITHGIGVGLSIAGLVLLLIKGTQNGSALEVVSYAIYGTTLILLYLASTLFHSLMFTKAKKIFQIFDHSSIYLLIAGTYTPYCLVTVGGPLGWSLFGVIWLMAILGVVYKCIWLGKYQNASTVIYIIMGWLCLIAMKPLYSGLGPIGFWLLVAGGVSFTVGALVYSMRSVRFMHVLWHLFVMLGTGFMYFSILLYA
ncbi:hemolysin III [Carnobacterium divergens]|uniref:Hemolysin III-like protein n=2 Tax=Carnobacterium divergens TaxID=2748 RepID=A0A0R2HWU3_CARDV|nr:hemolysin III family protein [Carnobacterium divergens]ANZ99974.1 hemolysin III [Carnobacterium divergens]KRN54346.1 hemolysin III-like protein [Carnobacterium divergens DSM 20623]MDO0873833.1 hemolysin III family protein [Carnobacterium divergens]MDT1959132.1 hemolysin III family protein [Carnobacterium divergens]MDT1975020.1 hemolysin III family protein [Carnobacterium divergens]